MQLNKYIDHTKLKSITTEADIKQLCQEAIKYEFKNVCVPPYYVALCKQLLNNTSVGITTVIGFPLGYTSPVIKQAAAEEAFWSGADEIDVVVNLAMVKNQAYKEIFKELKTLKIIAGQRIVKLILEISELTKVEIIKLCEIAVEAEIDFVKTSTGFSSHGATINMVKLMASTVNGKIEVKAAGGINDLSKCMAIIQAGATRIGTSNGVKIMEQFNKKQHT